MGLKMLSALHVARLQTERPAEEVANGGCELRAVRLQREVTRVEEADIGTGDVAFVRFGSRRQEERVVLAPDRQQRRLMLPEVRLERGVESDITGVVEEQIELHLVRSRARQIVIVQRAAVRRNQ